MLSRHEIIIAGCLRRLLKNKFILEKRSREWFKHIADCEKELKKVITTFGADLVVNQGLGVAYISHGPSDVEERIDYQLGTKLTLDKLTTIIILSLSRRRAEYLGNPENDICIVTKENIKEELIPFLEHIDKYREERALEKDLKESIRSLRELQVLLTLTEGSDVFEISSVCDILMPFEYSQRVRALVDGYIANSSSMDDRNTQEEL